MWQRLSREGQEKAGLRLCSQLSTCHPDPPPKHKRWLWGPKHTSLGVLQQAAVTVPSPTSWRFQTWASRACGLTGLGTRLSAAGSGGRMTLLTRAVLAGKPLPCLL